MRHHDIDRIPSFRPSRHGIRRNTRRVRERCSRPIEAVFVQLVRERPVPELGRVRTGVDVRDCAVGQGDLVGAFVEVRYAFCSRSAGGRCPEVSRGVDAGVGCFAAEIGGLAALGVLVAVGEDEVAVEGEVVVSSYY